MPFQVIIQLANTKKSENIKNIKVKLLNQQL